MNKKLLFSIIAIVLVLSSAIVYVILSPNKGTIANEMTTTTPKDTTGITTTDTTDTTQPGVYTEYSKEAIASTSGTKLLFFHAPWCPQCRQIEASINADGVPSGVTVFKVDYDTNQKLRQQYGVTLQTTFVKIDDDGNKIASYVAYEEPQFSSVERELLQ